MTHLVDPAGLALRHSALSWLVYDNADELRVIRLGSGRSGFGESEASNRPMILRWDRRRRATMRFGVEGHGGLIARLPRSP